MVPPLSAPHVAAVGDVVACRDARYREELKIPGELGLVVEARADRARVYFPTLQVEPWIPTGRLARVTDPNAAGVAPWMARACFLARTLEAQKLEVAALGAEGCALRIFHGETGLETLDRIRGELGGELRHFTLAPAGMHKIESSIAFTPATAPAGNGRPERGPERPAAR
jgi:hypothetical protein